MREKRPENALRRTVEMPRECCGQAAESEDAI
jgi:hypothetical protein